MSPPQACDGGRRPQSRKEFFIPQSDIILLTINYQRVKSKTEYAIKSFSVVAYFLMRRWMPLPPICVNPLLKMGRLRVFLNPALVQSMMDLAHKTQRQGAVPLFSAPVFCRVFFDLPAQMRALNPEGI